jgi:hypothetical protein
VRALQAMFEGDPEQRVAAEVQAAREEAQAEVTRRSQDWRVDVARAEEQLAEGDPGAALSTLRSLSQAMTP